MCSSPRARHTRPLEQSIISTVGAQPTAGLGHDGGTPRLDRHAPAARGALSCRVHACCSHTKRRDCTTAQEQLPGPVSATRTSKHLRARPTGRSEFARRPAGAHFWLRLSTRCTQSRLGRQHAPLPPNRGTCPEHHGPVPAGGRTGRSARSRPGRAVRQGRWQGGVNKEPRGGAPPLTWEELGALRSDLSSSNVRSKELTAFSFDDVQSLIVL